MSKQRKVSDVISDLEESTKTTQAIVSNIDNNTKLILDRLNRVADLLEKFIGQKPASPAIHIPKMPQQSDPAQRVQAKDNNIMMAHPLSEEIVDYDDNGFPELSEAVLPTGHKRGARVQAKAGNKIPVSQKIVLPDGKPLFLAHVEIFQKSDTGKDILVKQVRTNPKGRWVVPLEPGEYIVHVQKRISSDSNKLPVELRYSVSIPKSDSPLELPSPELPEIYKE